MDRASPALVLEGGVMKDWGEKPVKNDRSIRIEFGVLFLLHLVAIALVVLAFTSPNEANAHPGRTAADGCHNDRKNGGRHCHNGGTGQVRPQARSSGDVYYRNCDAARTAGAAPIRRGQPGYASHLDRDGDGIACE